MISFKEYLEEGYKNQIKQREPCAPFFFGSEESVQFMKTPK